MTALALVRLLQMRSDGINGPRALRKGTERTALEAGRLNLSGLLAGPRDVESDNALHDLLILEVERRSWIGMATVLPSEASRKRRQSSFLGALSLPFRSARR